MCAAAAHIPPHRRNSSPCCTMNHMLETNSAVAAAALAKLTRSTAEPGTAPGRSKRNHREERGKYPPEPPLIEAQERDASLLEVALENPGDKIAGDDEEHVDADKPAGNAGQAGVEQQDRHDRDRPQPVDVRAVFAARMRVEECNIAEDECGASSTSLIRPARQPSQQRFGSEGNLPPPRLRSAATQPNLKRRRNDNNGGRDRDRTCDPYDVNEETSPEMTGSCEL